MNNGLLGTSSLPRLQHIVDERRMPFGLPRGDLRRDAGQCIRTEWQGTLNSGCTQSRWGRVQTPDGYLVSLPNGATNNIHVFDLTARQREGSEFSFGSGGGAKYEQGFYWGGFVYAIPFDHVDIRKIAYRTKQGWSFGNAGAGMNHYCGALSPEGVIYVPRFSGSTAVLTVNLGRETTSSTRVAGTLPTGGWDVAIMVDSFIYCMGSNNGGVIGIIDWANDCVVGEVAAGSTVVSGALAEYVPSKRSIYRLPGVATPATRPYIERFDVDSLERHLIPSPAGTYFVSIGQGFDAHLYMTDSTGIIWRFSPDNEEFERLFSAGTASPQGRMLTTVDGAIYGFPSIFNGTEYIVKIETFRGGPLNAVLQAPFQ